MFFLAFFLSAGLRLRKTRSNIVEKAMEEELEDTPEPLQISNVPLFGDLPQGQAHLLLVFAAGAPSDESSDDGNEQAEMLKKAGSPDIEKDTPPAQLSTKVSAAINKRLKTLEALEAKIGAGDKQGFPGIDL